MKNRPGGPATIFFCFTQPLLLSLSKRKRDEDEEFDDKKGECSWGKEGARAKSERQEQVREKREAERKAEAESVKKQRKQDEKAAVI